MDWDWKYKPAAPASKSPPAEKTHLLALRVRILALPPQEKTIASAIGLVPCRSHFCYHVFNKASYSNVALFN